MSIVLNGLAPLVKEMRQRDLLRIRLQYRHGRVNFDVFFFIDESPWCLLFGAKGHNFAFEVKVRPGYSADTELAPRVYKGLCEALGLEYDPNNRFSPRGFLEQFGQALPATLPTRAAVQPHELAVFRSDVEESEKIYFCGWRDNTIRSQQVSEGNLQKTARLLGMAAYDHCRRRNISSCWSPDSEAAIAFSLPG